MSPILRAPKSAAAPAASFSWVKVAAIAFAFYLMSLGRGCQSIAPSQPPAGPDLVKAFSTNDDRGEAMAHAHVFATLCESIANCIEYDGKQPKPRITTGVQLDDLRLTMRQMRMGGWSFLTKYPELKDSVEKFLTDEVGTSGGPINETQRGKWVSAMRKLQACAQYAAERG